jgi:hypothetical protein
MIDLRADAAADQAVRGIDVGVDVIWRTAVCRREGWRRARSDAGAQAHIAKSVIVIERQAHRRIGIWREKPLRAIYGIEMLAIDFRPVVEIIPVAIAL